MQVSSLKLLWLSVLVLGEVAESLSSRQSDGLHGDRLCSRSMCVTAIVNGSFVDYVMTSTSRGIGWMAVGFGRAMGNSPMIVMWPNTDGSVTLSQRLSSGHSTPNVDANPPRKAVISQSYTVLSGSRSQLAFTIPTNGTNTRPFIIWAYGSTNPHSSATDAHFSEHDDMGEWQLDLARPVDFASPPSKSGTLPLFPPLPLYPYQRLIVAHAILCVVGFLLFLPAGVLLARYLRAFNPIWFQGHWIIQFALAGPLIVIGVALGIAAVETAGALHFGDKHRKYGFAIFFLYLAQCGLGAFIHFVKDKKRTRRPIQNYLHGLVGLITIGSAMYQIYNGFYSEWSNTTGRGPLSGGLTIFFWIGSMLLLAAYLGGLAFLPRQLRQENNSRPLSTRDEGEEYIRMLSQPNLHHPGPQTA
ncbi:hypothetical protein GALMADRAFT_273751 [Galerina marginata CBS 339.88]|uniref:Cytochrome b561 domain-containing protein n=1 Tax=Galerina marginata (strain CBS 339.88) TaxID=685588 RepID=A0A067S7W4_GALM3|nr:hypothetical protein GALMADRAFT_273751 [Galerina marginata CBS 339.88]